MLNKFWMLVLLIVLSFILPSCGKKGQCPKCPVCPRVTKKAVPKKPLVAFRTIRQIKKSGVLRIITRNNSFNYFIYKGKEMGFEYALAKRFAKKLGVRLEVVIAPGWSEIFPWLLQGRGDLVASSLTVTADRARKVKFTTPYNKVEEVAVTRRDTKAIKNVRDLIGKKIYVRKASSYYRSLKSLERKLNAKLDIQFVPDSMETERILALVIKGKYEATISDNNIAWAETTYGNTLILGTSISEPQGIAWALHPENTTLLAAANKFLYKIDKTVFYRVLYKRYFHSKKRLMERKSIKEEVHAGRLSPYDKIIYMIARKNGMDWRMVAAQIRQESGFDPRAKSWAGARGLMQLMPRTAKHLGVVDIENPEENIRAGVKHLKNQMRYFKHVPEERRIAFALAAYNVGIGHLRDAQHLAMDTGYNPLAWLGHTDKALLRLSQKKYFKRVKFGYCRGEEPVNYVRDIYIRYRNYKNVLPENPNQPTGENNPNGPTPDKEAPATPK